MPQGKGGDREGKGRRETKEERDDDRARTYLLVERHMLALHHRGVRKRGIGRHVLWKHHVVFQVSLNENRPEDGVVARRPAADSADQLYFLPPRETELHGLVHSRVRVSRWGVALRCKN